MSKNMACGIQIHTLQTVFTERNNLVITRKIKNDISWYLETHIDDIVYYKKMHPSTSKKTINSRAIYRIYL